MKIVIDRSACNVWDQACETHFSWHFLRDEITPVDCVIEVIDDGQPEKTFYLRDKDGVDKVLVVNDENWAEAYDSWIQEWERQQASNP